jgi:hypothetical protein
VTIRCESWRVVWQSVTLTGKECGSHLRVQPEGLAGLGDLGVISDKELVHQDLVRVIARHLRERSRERSLERVELWGAIRGHPRPSAAIRGHQRPSVAISGHQRSSARITCERSSEAISCHQRSSARTTCERILRNGEPTFPVCIASSILSSHATLLPDERGRQRLMREAISGPCELDLITISISSQSHRNLYLIAISISSRARSHRELDLIGARSHRELKRTCRHELAVQLRPGRCAELVWPSREEPRKVEPR